MRIDEYLDKVCDEIRWKIARKPVREEISAHILQRAEEYMADGDTAETAEEKAVANMGEAAQTGKELNRLHKPRYDWVLIGALAGLLVLGLLFTVTSGYYSWYHNWPVTTTIGLAVCFLFTIIDIRRLVSGKAIYLSLFFVCVLLLAVSFVLREQLQASIILLDRFPVIGQIVMILSAGVWIKDIKTGRGFVLFLATAATAALALLMVPATGRAESVIPAIPLTITFLVCIWAMLWRARIKKKILAILVVTVATLLFLVIYVFSEPYRVSRLTETFNDASGAGFVFWQIKYRVASLNWFSAGTATPEIVINFSGYHEYALINYMWNYGAIAGLIVVSLCGVVLWRIYRMLLGIKDAMGRTIAIGLCTYITMQVVWNVLMNFGVAPYFISSFIPMFSQVWSQSLVFGSVLGILIGLYRKKDIYRQPSESLKQNSPSRSIST